MTSHSRCARDSASCDTKFKINDATAAKTTKFAYLIDKNKSFARPSRAFFKFRAFLSSSRQICDVK